MALTKIMQFLQAISARAAKQVVNRFRKRPVKPHAKANHRQKATPMLNER